jgi:hypothetical protein
LEKRKAASNCKTSLLQRERERERERDKYPIHLFQSNQWLQFEVVVLTFLGSKQTPFISLSLSPPPLKPHLPSCYPTDMDSPGSIFEIYIRYHDIRSLKSCQTDGHDEHEGKISRDALAQLSKIVDLKFHSRLVKKKTYPFELNLLFCWVWKYPFVDL